jgi:ADP-heptose:LPS heptosyltransferase
MEDVADALKREKFDAMIDLHHNIRTLKLKRTLRTKSYSFPKLNIQKWMLVNLHINRMPSMHIVDRYLSTVKSFGVKNDLQGLSFHLPKEVKNPLEELPESHRNGYIAIAIGAQHSTKIMPSEKVSRIIQKTGKPVVVLGGKEDRTRGAQIVLACGEMVYNACGKMSLAESAILLREAKVVLSHDTGLMHIAAAFRKPIVTVWGNTVPAFGMTPYMPGDEDKSIIIENNSLRCRPCSKIGFDKCPKGHFECIRGIDDAEISEAIIKLWRN